MWLVQWVENGKNRVARYSEYETAHVFALTLQSRHAGGERIGGIRIDKLPPDEPHIVTK